MEDKKRNIQELVRQAVASGMVHALAHELGTGYGCGEDLRSAGLVALVVVSQRFDPSRGVEFTRYARRRVYGAMLDELRRLGPVRRKRRKAAAPKEAAADEPLPRAVGIEAAFGIANDCDPEAELDRQRHLRLVRQAVARLPPRLQLVYRLRFEEGLRLKKIGEILGGVTASWACQLVGEIVARLRNELALNNGREGENGASR